VPGTDQHEHGWQRPTPQGAQHDGAIQPLHPSRSNYPELHGKHDVRAVAEFGSEKHCEFEPGGDGEYRDPEHDEP